MRRTLRIFYGVARMGAPTVRYHSKVQAIPQRKKVSAWEPQISLLTLFWFRHNINSNFKILTIMLHLRGNPKEGKSHESCCVI